MSLRMLRPVSMAAIGCAVLAAVSFTTARQAAPSDLAAMPPEVEAAMKTINKGRIRAHLKFLADDDLEGRGTGQKGGDIAANYIATILELSGLWRGGAGNSFMQRVPLVGVEVQPESTLSIEGAASGVITLVFKNDAVYWTQMQQPLVDHEGELIFVGYGVDAPELKWDDYKGVDVAGKVLVMLVNDPPSDDPAHFGGKALTYYGRWTYKYEIAARKGAAGALLIHTDASAGYGWEVVRNSWARERFVNELDAATPAPLRQGGWVTDAAAQRIFTAAGQNLDMLRAAAAKPDFTPVPLGLKSRAHIVSKVRKVDTVNVIAYAPGTDEALKDQAVMVTAHYDHFGLGDPDESGDRIYNGAYDNASGVATMLEMARAFRLASVKPRRSVVFIAAAAEEMGLLGSEYYAGHPTIPPGKIAAAFNLDGVSVLGASKDMIFLGGERSSLKAIIEDAARGFGFTIAPDSHPEQGSFYRSDHFNFARIGVPAISIKHGESFEGKDPAWGSQQWKEYNEKRYHRPSDEYQADWDLAGAEKTAMISFYLAYRAAMSDQMPAWNAGDEFAGVREKALKAAATSGK